MPPPKKQRLSASNPGASSQPPKPTSGVKLLSTAPEGSGTTASVYKAVSENPNPEFSSILGKEVAVKKISPENSGRECWDNEKRAVTHMPVDSGLLRLYWRYYSSKGYLCIVSELLTGMTLEEKMRNSGEPISEARIQKFLRGPIAGLAKMHERSIIHRDIKLGNIMTVNSKTSTSKVIDYGYNHIMTNNQEPTSLVGTLIYLAPEQILKMKANSKIIIPAPLSRRKTNGTTKTDVWSVGICAYILICHNDPYRRGLGNTSRGYPHLWDDIQKGNFVVDIDNLEATDLAKRWLKRVLEVDPNKRCTMAEARDDPWIHL